MVIKTWLDGWRRVGASPAIAAGVLVTTLVFALPLALSLRGLLALHLGSSLMADEAADAVNYDWWQEFSAQAAGLGLSFTPTILGFASTLDTLSGVLDARFQILAVSLAAGAYVLAWTFLAGGILDRYARQRRTRASGFFGASGVYFFRFLRLAVVAGALYWWLFSSVHAWLFADLLPPLTRDLDVERTVFLWRAVFYCLFGGLLIAANMLFDYAKIRIVVEDRRSSLGGLLAAIRFVRRNPGRTSGLYLLNALQFLALIGIWALIAPGAGGPGASLGFGILAGQLYLLVRLLLKLHFLASQTSLFQASLAHAEYTAAPEPVWPDSPAAETITAR
jgi:hypothetical protein